MSFWRHSSSTSRCVKGWLRAVAEERGGGEVEEREAAGRICSQLSGPFCSLVPSALLVARAATWRIVTSLAHRPT